MTKLHIEINDGFRIAAIVLIVTGFLISLTIVGAVVGIPLIIVGLIMKRLSIKKVLYER